MRVGLTGGVASGKSTVATLFAQRGVPVIDTDEIARAVVAPGQPALAEVVRAFGSGVLAPDGTLDRAQMRTLVFSDTKRRRRLEKILHPRILEEMENRAATAGGPYQVLVIPLLVETGLRARVDRVLVVDADESVQMARLKERDGADAGPARAMIAAQIGRAGRLAVATEVIVNNGDRSTLDAQVARLHEQYLVIAAATRPAERP